MSEVERHQYVKNFTAKHLSKEQAQIEDGLLEQFHAPWKNAMKKSQVANQLFKNILKFDEVSTFTNPKKSDIVKVLQQLKQ